MDERLRALGSREVERILRKYDFSIKRREGSHQQFVGVVEAKKRRVTVLAGQRSFARKTLASMIRQSGLSEQQWLAAL